MCHFSLNLIFVFISIMKRNFSKESGFSKLIPVISGLFIFIILFINPFFLAP